jgi:outer membrane protein assembly factor BamB
MAKRSRSNSQLKSTLIIILVSVCILAALLLLKQNLSQSLTEVTPSVIEAFTGSSRWRYNAKHTGASPSIDITKLPTQKWAYSCIKKDSNSFPAITDDTVYVICPGNPNSTTGDQGQGIYAFDKTSGALKWRNKNPGCGTTVQFIQPAPMEVINSNIYTFICNEVTTINSTNGAVKWRSTNSHVRPPAYSVPLVGNNYVYIGGSNTLTGTGVSLLAINKTDGSTVWNKSYVNSLVPQMALDISNTTPPIETLYVSGGGVAQAMKGADGTILWSKAFSSPVNMPAMQYSNVYFGSKNGQVYALNSTTGATVWTFVADGGTSDMVSVAQNLVVFATNKGSLYAVNAATGLLKWKVSYGIANPTVGGLAPSPTVISSSGTIFIGTLTSEVKAYDVSGKLLYTIPAAPGTSTTGYTGVIFDPIVVGGHIYLGTYSGSLRVY